MQTAAEMEKRQKLKENIHFSEKQNLPVRERVDLAFLSFIA